MAELSRFAKRYRARAERLERELEGLRVDRDEQIRRAAAGGVPVVEIAKQLGMTHQRVSKIVRGR